MLQALIDLAERKNIDFVFLIADTPNLYAKHGFKLVPNVCSWLRIEEHKNYGIGQEQIDDIMVKQIGSKKWPEGPIDLLGYMF